MRKINVLIFFNSPCDFYFTCYVLERCNGTENSKLTCLWIFTRQVFCPRADLSEAPPANDFMGVIFCNNDGKNLDLHIFKPGGEKQTCTCVYILWKSINSFFKGSLKYFFSGTECVKGNLILQNIRG